MQKFLGVDLALLQETLSNYTDKKWLDVDDMLDKIDRQMTHLRLTTLNRCYNIDLNEYINKYIYLCEVAKKGLAKSKWLPNVLNEMSLLQDAEVLGLDKNIFRPDHEHKNKAIGATKLNSLENKISDNWYVCSNCYIQRHKQINIERALSIFSKLFTDNKEPKDPFAVATQIVYSASIMQKLQPYLGKNQLCDDLYNRAKSSALAGIQILRDIPEEPEQELAKTTRKRYMLFSCHSANQTVPAVKRGDGIGFAKKFG